MLDQSKNTGKPNYRIKRASFIISSPNLRKCPEPTFPEIAIAGRSNVGKSSLINQICNQRRLAKTSGTPGKTQLINFFHLVIDPNDRDVHLVDLPGYGYSKVDKATQKQWGIDLQEFLDKRPLTGILHLVDSRHEPTDLDLQMREFILFKEIPAITVLTKTDKLSKPKLSKAIKQITHILQISKEEPVIITSALKKAGTHELIKAIAGLLTHVT